MPARILLPEDLPAAPPMIISESPTHVVIAVEVARATLAGDVLMHQLAGSPDLMGNFRLGNQVTIIYPEDFSANISLLNVTDGR